MSGMRSTVVSLRVFADGLEPKVITDLMGCDPSEAWARGDAWVSGGEQRIRRTGHWRLVLGAEAAGDLDEKIEVLLSRVTSQLDRWRDLAQTCQADVFCGLFMQSGNDGVALRPETLLKLGQRGLALELDIYGDDDDD